ncbi:MAG: flavodoxin family protein [Ruminococcaceae bacterium]|nr:flavodoxin family protein [Oscillospiraceae bacterium]
MKVILFNGSPKKNGCTYTALAEVEKELNNAGIDTLIFHAGEATKGCMGCKYCVKNGKCITDDCVNEAAKLLEDADGIVLGTPVHYAAASGMMTAFLDRLFYSAGDLLRLKPCAAVACCRRGGSSSTLDQLLKYPEIKEMPIVNAQYWTMLHGNTPDEIKQDLEGMQAMRTIGKNMAWILKCIDAGKKAGINIPDAEEKVRTNFIR